ncbi:hypothetical protein Tco_0922057 [Tanacetum coccineum]|uniref:Uncharacterized protein n=1 Tax=Tanacetum coccineum TaxID=301880 RepID=A0ABQ5CZD7_9ASTR
MSVYLLVLYALFACVDAVNDLDVFSLSVSYSVVLVNQETVYMIRSFACVGYASIEGDHWSPKATFLLWELRHVARADSLTSESAHAEKYNSIVDTRSLDKIDTRAHVGNYKCTVCVTILYVTLYTQEIDARGLLALGRVIEGLAVWKQVDTPYRAMWDTAYWGFLGVRTTFDIFQNILLLYCEYGVLMSPGYDVLGLQSFVAYQLMWMAYSSPPIVRQWSFDSLKSWIRRIGLE